VFPRACHLNLMDKIRSNLSSLNSRVLDVRASNLNGLGPRGLNRIGLEFDS
jgi:hypothetical protein